MVTFGRKRIFIDKEITEENIPLIITEAMKIHSVNSTEIQYLVDYYLGKQDILNRADRTFTDINNQIVFNYTEETVRDIIGYTFGKPAQYTQKKSEYRDDIQEITDVLDYENASAIDIKTQTFVSIGGIGYEITLPKGDYDDTPEIPLKIRCLDPRNTFHVSSGEIGNRSMLKCTYCDINEINVKYRMFYVFTDTSIYIYKVKGVGNVVQQNNLVMAYNHLLGGNPITEYENNMFLTGDFEKAITVLNAINELGSDAINDVQQFVQSILVFVNAEIDQGGIDNIKTNRVIQIKSVIGLQSDVKYIYSNIDVKNIAEARSLLIDVFHSITGIPTMGSSSNGQSTGIATEYKDGWVQLEIVAKNKEMYFKEAKKHQLKVILTLLKRARLINEKLGVQYIKIDLPRNKNDNIQTKSQAYSTLVATNTLDPVDALEFVDITTDINEVVARGKKYNDEKQKVLNEQNKATENKAVDKV